MEHRSSVLKIPKLLRLNHTAQNFSKHFNQAIYLSMSIHVSPVSRFSPPPWKRQKTSLLYPLVFSGCIEVRFSDVLTGYRNRTLRENDFNRIPKQIITYTILDAWHLVRKLDNYLGWVIQRSCIFHGTKCYPTQNKTNKNNNNNKIKQQENKQINQKEKKNQKRNYHCKIN